MGRAALGNVTRLCLECTRLERWRIYTRKCHQSLFVFKTTNITDFCHKSWTSDWPGTFHPHNNIVFWQKRCQALHFMLRSQLGLTDCVQTLASLGDQNFCTLALWQSGNTFFR